MGRMAGGMVGRKTCWEECLRVGEKTGHGDRVPEDVYVLTPGTYEYLGHTDEAN